MTMAKPSDDNDDTGRKDEQPGAGAGEDEGSSAKEGDETHLKEDQKTPAR
jgi:hypothetical protein